MQMMKFTTGFLLVSFSYFLFVINGGVPIILGAVTGTYSSYSSIEFGRGILTIFVGFIGLYFLAQSFKSMFFK